MLEIAKGKIRAKGITIKQGDMKELPNIFPRERFDAAISLGHVAYHLNTAEEARAFFKGVHKILKRNGLFVFNARNAKKIDDNLLNNLRLGHLVNEDKVQIVVMEHNTRDPTDPNTIIWRSIFLVKENERVDFQTREHKLRWFQFKELKRLLLRSGFRLVSTYAGSTGEAFKENLHADMWFAATAKWMKNRDTT
jgi:SAM-dependent methyltransferase